MVDWIAVFDATTERCYYVPSRILGTDGLSDVSLRLTPARNGQTLRIRPAEDYLDPDFQSGSENGASRIRTGDIHVANVALCQLSYGPVWPIVGPLPLSFRVSCHSKAHTSGGCGRKSGTTSS
jgi:hypothetical protein